MTKQGQHVSADDGPPDPTAYSFIMVRCIVKMQEPRTVMLVMRMSVGIAVLAPDGKSS
jgi:hypothetical protein